jgi:single-stranded-DNA-specific exonuclease
VYGPRTGAILTVVRGLNRNWAYRGGGPALGAALPTGAPGSLVARVLAVRGLSEPSAARAFLEPKLLDLHDPALMPDLDLAARRLLDAAAAREPIVIYGDYDVDGITATTILFHTLRAIDPGAIVGTYVPHRIDEGYGLNSGAIEELAGQGARVIVSVDCGVTAVEPALVARRLGVDLIITDHHNPPATLADLPPAFAVVHPRRPGPDGAPAYPFGDLSGAGVAYKLAWRLATLFCGSERVSGPLRELLVELLAFASLGIIADVVPLVGENRVIARFGLARIRTSPFVGLRALVDASGLGGEKVNAMDVGFKLGPRLNAAGRLGHAREAVELFTTAAPARAQEIAAALSRQNTARRAVEHEIFEQAAAMAEAAGMTSPERRAIVLADERWHPGVVGIVCSRLVERYCRPAILMQRKNGVCHGSGRSIDGFNLHAALVSCAPLLGRFGGHDMAAGLHLAEHHLAEFTEAFTAVANAALGPDDLVHTLAIDCDAAIEELTAEAVGHLQALAPFGRENPEVRVRLRGLVLAAPPQSMGAFGKHAAIQVRSPASGAMMRLVAWGWGEKRESLRTGMPLEAVIEPKLNAWNGRVTVEGELKDLAI